MELLKSVKNEMEKVIIALIKFFSNAMRAVAYLIMKIIKGGKKVGQNVVDWQFGLKVYGDDLLTNKAKKEINAFAVILLLQMFLDFWAWNKAWSYGLPEQTFVPMMLAVVFALAILIFDRSIVTLDTTKNGKFVPMTIRIAILLMLAFVTAIPVELGVFQSEIDQRIEEREKVSIDTIREKAIAEIQTELQSEESGGNTVKFREKALNDLKQDRAEKRKSYHKDFNDKSQLAAMEVAGKGISGKYGRGPAYKAMKAAADEALTTLNAFDTETNRLIAKFNNKSQELVGDKKEEAKAEIKKIRETTPSELADLYGGSWKQSRGFLARFTELRKMEEEDPTVSYVTWGTRIIMIAIGILILGLKFMSSSELREYYNFRAHLADGTNKDVKTLAKAVGYSQEAEVLSKVGMAEDLKAMQEKCTQTSWWCLQLLANFKVEMLHLGEELDSKGLHLSLKEIQSRLYERWTEDVLPILRGLYQDIEKAEQEGLIAKIPKEVASALEVAKGQPWLITAEDLKGTSWEDPQTKIETAKEALKEIHDIHETMELMIDDMNEPLAVAISRDNKTSREMLKRMFQDRRYRFWKENLASKFRKLNILAKDVQAGGMKVPNWDVSEECWHIPEAAQLTRAFGWADQEYEKKGPDREAIITKMTETEYKILETKPDIQIVGAHHNIN